MHIDNSCTVYVQHYNNLGFSSDRVFPSAIKVVPHYPGSSGGRVVWFLEGDDSDLSFVCVIIETDEKLLIRQHAPASMIVKCSLIRLTL